MKRFRDVFIGVIIGCMLMATPVLADSILTKIDVILNGVNVQLEGNNVQVDSILYNGTTYLPMRKVAELVGKDIQWNQDTKTANIVNKTDVKEGDSVTEQPTEDYKIIKEEDNKILVIQKDGKEYYSWDYIAQFERPKGVTIFIGGSEYRIIDGRLQPAQSTDTIEIDESNYVKIGIDYYISKDYYENIILPLINK